MARYIIETDFGRFEGTSERDAKAKMRAGRDAGKRLARHAPALRDALVDMVDMFTRKMADKAGPADAAQRWDRARALLDSLA